MEARNLKDTSEKVDKGFVFLYSKLSYRRKFIRTMWIIMFTPFIVFFTLNFANENGVFPFELTRTVLITSLVLMGLGLIQAVYNYRKWQEIKTGRD